MRIMRGRERSLGPECQEHPVRDHPNITCDTGVRSRRVVAVIRRLAGCARTEKEPKSLAKMPVTADPACC
jgi:hypothetical protein